MKNLFIHTSEKGILQKWEGQKQISQIPSFMLREDLKEKDAFSNQILHSSKNQNVS